ncbi:MAG TPA: glycerophosphodiester phosphodiesterase [Candidatus Krumholzibacteria bacterium]|nr:glycerophosphodiester phosphodiesterase [Candidatus Krumholzibacteria bacterium]
MSAPLVLAHRGWSARAVENTLEAMRLAAASPADGVELDVHETLDGGFVVHHDRDVPHGLIAALPQSFITGHDGKAGAPVPSLREVLGLLAERPGRSTVFVEVKSMRSWNRLRSLLAPWREALDLEVQSFEPAILDMAAAAAEDIPLGWIAREPGPDPVGMLRRFGARTLSLHHEACSAELAAALHVAGFRLSAWTVNDAARARALAGMGVDVLIGDDPELLHGALIDFVTT